MNNCKCNLTEGAIYKSMSPSSGKIEFHTSDEKPFYVVHNHTGKPDVTMLWRKIINKQWQQYLQDFL